MLANPPSAYGSTHHHHSSPSTSTSTSASSSSGSGPYTPVTPPTHLSLLHVAPSTAVSSTAVTVPGSNRKPHHRYSGSTASYVIRSYPPAPPPPPASAAIGRVRVIVDEDEDDVDEREDVGAESDVSAGLTGFYAPAHSQAKRRVRRAHPESQSRTSREEQERTFRRTSALHDRPLSILSTAAPSLTFSPSHSPSHSPAHVHARLPSPVVGAPSLTFSPTLSNSPPPQLVQDIETSPLRAASALLPFLGSGSDDSHVSSGSRHSRQSRQSRRQSRHSRSQDHGYADGEDDARRYDVGYEEEYNYDPEGRYSPLEQSVHAYARADAEAAAILASRRRSTGSGSGSMKNGYGYGFGYGAGYGYASKPVVVDLSHDGHAYDSYGVYENGTENRYSNSYDADGEVGFVPVPAPLSAVSGPGPQPGKGRGRGRGRSASDSTANTSDSGHQSSLLLRSGAGVRTRRRLGLEGEALQKVLEQRRTEWVVAKVGEDLALVGVNGTGEGAGVGVGVTSRFFDDDEEEEEEVPADVRSEKRARRGRDEDAARGCFEFLRPSSSRILGTQKTKASNTDTGRWSFSPKSLPLSRTKIGKGKKKTDINEKGLTNAEIGLNDTSNINANANTADADSTFLNIFESNTTRPYADVEAAAPPTTTTTTTTTTSMMMMMMNQAQAQAQARQTTENWNWNWYWRVRARWTAVKLRVRLGAFRARRRAGLV